MKDKKFKKAIGEIRKISMTSAEKQRILGRVLETTSATNFAHKNTPIKNAPVKSVWTIYSFSTWIETHRWITSVAVIIVVLVGNSAVLASHDSLPGDALYSIKTNIVEPIRVAIATTPMAKAEIQTELVQNRLYEAETLASRGQLDEVKEQSINRRLEKQVANLNTNISKVEKTSPEKADDMNTTLEANVNAHAKILAAIAIDQGESRVDKTKPVVLEKKDQAVSRTTFVVSTTVENSATKQVKGSKKFSKRKDFVKSLMQDVSKDLDAATTTATSSDFQQTITNDAKVTLDRAQKKLEDAEMHSDSGHENEAYSDLRDSERATKEAGIFIKAKFRLSTEGE